ncbi:hypothetical protein Tco_0144788 [Tanacetum coccineum]
MDTTKAQQKALDDDLVAPTNRLQIGKCNLRLSSTLKSKEPTIQVVLDALKLTSFYKAFEITAGVPEIYMQEFWICPKLPGQKFEDPQFEEEILSFNRDLGHTESEAYKTYDAYATGEKIPKPKYVKNKVDPESSPKKNMRGNMGVSLESEHDDDQDDDNADNEGDDDQDDDNEHTELDNDDDDFVYPKLSTFDEKERQDEEDKEEEWSDDEAYDEVTQGVNGRDTKMTDALLANVQTTQVIEDTHVIITDVTTEVQQQSSSVSSGFISNMLNPNPDTGIDSILNLNTESTSLVDVPVTANVEMPPSSVTTLPLPPIPFSQPLQQTPVPTPTIVPSTSLQNLPTFDSLFKFEDRVKALEDNFSEFKQTNLFAEVVSLIPGIVDTYLANKMNEAVKEVVQLQSDRLRKESQANNEDFINKIDENKIFDMRGVCVRVERVYEWFQVSKILPKIENSVNEQLEAEVLIHKMEKNKSIDISVQQNTLYKALVDAYESDKDILASYGDTVTLKIHRDDEDEDEEPSAGSDRGPREEELEKNLSQLVHQRRRLPSQLASLKKGPNLMKSLLANQPVDKTAQHPDWFQKPTKSLTPDRDWNKTLPAKHGPVQPWISTLAWNEDPRESFNELMYTPLDFSAFVMKRFKVYTLTSELLAGPTYELIKGKLTNLNVEERLALGVSLRMFSRSVVLRRRMEDLQLGVESYQKKLNLTRLDTYRSDLK